MATTTLSIPKYGTGSLHVNHMDHSVIGRNGGIMRIPLITIFGQVGVAKAEKLEKDCWKRCMNAQCMAASVVVVTN